MKQTGKPGITSFPIGYYDRPLVYTVYYYPHKIQLYGYIMVILLVAYTSTYKYERMCLYRSLYMSPGIQNECPGCPGEIEVVRVTKNLTKK